ncbi:MAG: DUF4124 domain-containing protein [Pseudomonadota bacterium]|nr:MAG: DUF4124 domain-containing protein [Pseudomonadota bacterium]
MYHSKLTVAVLLLTAGLLAGSEQTAADTAYKCVDAQGVTHYSQFPPEQSCVEEVAVLALDSTTPTDWDSATDPHSIQNQVQRLASEREAREAEWAARRAELAKEREAREQKAYPPDGSHYPYLYRPVVGCRYWYPHLRHRCYPPVAVPFGHHRGKHPGKHPGQKPRGTTRMAYDPGRGAGITPRPAR